jgi:GAF domain-containing protein
MPYVRCPGCRLRTYCVSGEECPRCGAPLGGPPRTPAQPAPPDAGPDPAPFGGPIERVLALACSELSMDAALVSEIRDGREVVRWAVGGERIAGALPGASAPLEDTICRRLLDGDIGNVVEDTAADPHVGGLPAVRLGPIGAYIGVPMTSAAARRYVLCCLAREARPGLGDADVRFLLGLVESLRPRVDRAG